VRYGTRKESNQAPATHNPFADLKEKMDQKK